MKRYYVGSGVRISLAFANVLGSAADPTTVAVIHQDPSGTRTELSPASSGTGLYYVDYVFVDDDAAGSGVNEFEVLGTGAVAVADKIQIKVSTL